MYEAEIFEQAGLAGGDLMAATSQTEALAAVQVLLAAGVPVLLWGDPGTGKTETVQRIAAAAGWRTETVIVSLHEATDFAGLPVRTPGGVVFDPPAWARNIADHDGECLVFFDEVNTAPPAVQNALMRVVLERRVADLDLGEGVRFIAAANPPEQNIGAWDLSAPLANRFAHLRWPVTFEEWRRGYLHGWAETGPLRIPDGAPDPALVAAHKASQAGFLDARRHLLCDPPRPGAPAVYGWPSPRTWERAARCMAVAEQAEASDEAVMLAAAALLGAGTAVEYLAYEDSYDLPSVDDLLADPDAFARLERSDVQHAALAAVVAAAKENPKPKQWARAFKVCIAAARHGAPDIAAAAAAQLVDVKPPKIGLPKGHEVFTDILDQDRADPAQAA